MVKLDSNAAWKEAAGLVAANRELLFVLAGVFFLLPSLLLSTALGEPQVAPGADSEQMAAALLAFYGSNWWAILLGTAVQIVGMLTILRLMRDRRRPTVGEAIRAGLTAFPSYLAAQLLFVFALGLGGGLIVGLVAMVVPALAAVLTLVLLVFALFAALRLILAAPIVAVDGERNPLAALARSWATTRGNFWRIFVFLALVGVLFLVASAVIMIVVGILLAVVTQGEVQRVLASVVSSALSALAMLYLLGILAAIHRQLAGSGEARPAPFR
jgi:hypothetical protein